ncbi:hypothetical protein FQN54_004038 [Arachnomyces sp. PD_36]|nr:hypothetical protein FQN54_004038 [Arachnomyces sp. PD_36]
MNNNQYPEPQGWLEDSLYMDLEDLDDPLSGVPIDLFLANSRASVGAEHSNPDGQTNEVPDIYGSPVGFDAGPASMPVSHSHETVVQNQIPAGLVAPDAYPNASTKDNEAAFYRPISTVQVQGALLHPPGTGGRLSAVSSTNINTAPFQHRGDVIAPMAARDAMETGLGSQSPGTLRHPALRNPFTLSVEEDQGNRPRPERVMWNIPNNNSTPGPSSGLDPNSTRTESNSRGLTGGADSSASPPVPEILTTRIVSTAENSGHRRPRLGKEEAPCADYTSPNLDSSRN